MTVNQGHRIRVPPRLQHSCQCSAQAMAYTSFLVPSLKTSQHTLGGVYTNTRYGHSIASFAAWKSILPDNVSDLSRLPLRYISCCQFLCSKSPIPLLIFMPLYIGAAIATVKHTCWEFYRRIGDKTKASLRRVIHRVFRLNLTALTP
jgi:hypothetical protein